MGEISIHFRMNTETGEKIISIEYDSDEDAMRHEHEKRHRQIVEQLVGEGILTAEEAEEVVIERSEPGLRSPEAQAEGEPEAEANSAG